MTERGRAMIRQWYVLALLSLVYAMNIADRYVITTVMESIRLDLHLTDSGVALLTGVALALFYVTIGIPVSALADRYSRRNIIAISDRALGRLHTAISHPLRHT